MKPIYLLDTSLQIHGVSRLMDDGNFCACMVMSIDDIFDHIAVDLRGSVTSRVGGLGIWRSRQGGAVEYLKRRYETAFDGVWVLLHIVYDDMALD